MLEHEPHLWRVGLTKFAARMLGDVVDISFDATLDTAVSLGDPVGWLEGFKARTDLYTVVAGRFAGGNPELDQDIDVIDRDRYGRGWLYQVRGTADGDACDAAGYAAILDATIDRMRGRSPHG